MYVLLQKHIIAAVVEDRACGCQRWSFSSTRWLGGSGSAVSNHRGFFWDSHRIIQRDCSQSLYGYIRVSITRVTVPSSFQFVGWSSHFQCVPTDLMWNTGRCHFKREKLVCKPTSGTCFCCFFVPHDLKIFILPAIFVVDGFACHHFPLVAAWWARAFFHGPPSFSSDGSHSKHPSVRSSFWDWLKEPAVNWHDRPNYVLIILILI